MTATETPPAVPPELAAAVQAALNNPGGGILDPEAARLACERMDRMREENFRLFGEQNVAVELIRQGREQP